MTGGPAFHAFLGKVRIIRRSVRRQEWIEVNWCAALLLLISPAFAATQGSGQQAPPSMPGMSMPSSDQESGVAGISMQPQNFLEEITAHTSSGTSAEPDSTPTPMLMTMKGSWMLMVHANAFITDEQESSRRGRDKLFSTNWLMPMAQRGLGRGIFTIRTMLSLEPATITGRQYPLLFQQGETAFGLPIADAQHPHNFFMELAALYDLKLGSKTLLSFYAAPVGDPAIGPTAYPHRASALEDPVGALGHHQEDSTHISDDVLTAGLTYRIVRIEASGFHGREPERKPLEHPPGRYRFVVHPLDTSTRKELERAVFLRSHRKPGRSLSPREPGPHDRFRDVQSPPPSG